MVSPPAFRLLLAAQVLCTPLGAAAQGASPAPLTQLSVEGGSLDDAAFARAASGILEGRPLDEGAFRLALEAVRNTDRFRQVTGELLPCPGGVAARVRLEPWPALDRLDVEGLARRQVPGGLRIGRPVGSRRLEAWRRQFQLHLRETGYPAAQVGCERTREDRGLKVRVAPGPPDRLAEVEVVGRIAPYTREEIVRMAGVVPGRTLWTASSRLELLNRLRNKLMKDKRFESQVEAAWEAGVLRLTVEAGPVVVLRSEGDSLGWTTSLKDVVGLARANRYSPELLDEGDRRILRVLRGKGYLEAQVSHRREVLQTGPDGPERVRITFTVRRGETSPIGSIRFEGNREVPGAELVKAADLPFSFFSAQGPEATPELMDGVEARVKNLYLSRGYPDASVRLLPLRRTRDRCELVYLVSEGPRRLVQWLKLDLPGDGLGDPWGLGECLTRVLAERPLRVAVGLTRRYASDDPALKGVEGTLAIAPAPGGGTSAVLTLSRPIPLLRTDLAKVFNALRQQRLPALGVVRPVVRMTLEDTPGGTGIHLVVPDQALEKVRRLVVSGSGKTRARAVLRETQLDPGSPLDLSTLSRMQARLSFMGAFQRVDVTNLSESGAEGPAPAGAAAPDAGAGDGPGTPPPGAAPGPPAPGAGPAPPAAVPPAGPPSPWQQGDLLLRLEERPPYVVTNSFGYDNTQGYHFGSGIQWLNVGGMGRTVDAGIRAGDGTINNPTLRKWFPTGPYDRSVDSFSLGYNDPWFEPPALAGWLADRTRLATEGAYIEERRSLYLLHRRRVTASLEWLLSPRVSFQTGYRFERVNTAAAEPDISSYYLSLFAHYPEQATISAPFVQLARDTRDNPLDPTQGSYSVARLELANQLFGTSPTNSFIKVDLRQQWTWPVGRKASAGVVALGVRVGMARPTASSARDLPLSERFFAGGSFTQRGVEPDGLGPVTSVPLRSPTPPFAIETDAYGNQLWQVSPLGGQGLALVNLEYRFPLFSRSIWGEVFVDSGQVYAYLSHKDAAAPVADQPVIPPAVLAQTASAQFPPFRTSLGLGLIFKWSIPIKLEYAADYKRVLGMPRPSYEVATQLKGLSISAGFQF